MERIISFGRERCNIILIHCGSHLSKWPQRVMTLVVYALMESSPPVNRVGLCNQQDTAEIMMCDFQGWDIKDTVASTLSSFLDHLVQEKPAATMRDPQVALWGHTHGEGPRSHAYSQQGFTNYVNESSCKFTFQSQASLEMSAALADILTTTS